MGQSRSRHTPRIEVNLHQNTAFCLDCQEQNCALNLCAAHVHMCPITIPHGADVDICRPRHPTCLPYLATRSW